MCSRRSGRATHIGPVGTGQMTKLANQIIVGATMVAVAEALHFAAQGGADPAAVRQALMGGFADFENPQHPRRAHGRAQFRARRAGGIRAQGPAHGAGAGRHGRLALYLARLPDRHVRRHDRSLRASGSMSPASCRKSSGAPARPKESAKETHDRACHAHDRGRHRADRARPPGQDERDHAGDDAGIAARLPRDRRQRATCALPRSPAPASAPSPPAAISTRLADLTDIMAFRNRVEYARWCAISASPSSPR